MACKYIVIITLLITHCFNMASAKSRLSFEYIFDEMIPGGKVYSQSTSFISESGDSLIESVDFEVPNKILENFEAGFLFITGESSKIDKQPAAKFSTPVKLHRSYKLPSVKTLYNNVYFVFPGKIKQNKITISEILSEKINPAGKHKYSIAAATLILIHSQPSRRQNRIRIFAGLSNPTPGNIYKFRFKKEPGYKPVSISIAGGHGIKGNATGNILNGKTLSGGDDWDGSSGTLWDFDTYDLSKWSFRNTSKRYIFGIDTILNWIYPEILIFVEEVR